MFKEKIKLVNVKTLNNHTNYINNIELINDRKIITCSGDKKIIVLNGNVKKIIRLHSVVVSLTVCDDKKHFITSMLDKTIRIWNEIKCIKLVKN